MNSKEYLDNLKLIQDNILKYVDIENNIEENYENAIKLFEDVKIRDNLHEIKIILRLLSNIACYHHRYTDFFKKIEKIILYFKKEIETNYTNFEIFKLFKSNNRILLFLIREKLLIIDKTIYEELKKIDHKAYFYPETKAFKEMETNQQKDNDNDKDKEENNKEDEESDSSDEYYYKKALFIDVSFEYNSDIESSDVFNSNEPSYEESDEERSFKENKKEEKHNKSTNLSNKHENNQFTFENDPLIKYYSFLTKKDSDESAIDEEKREIGENDNELCQLIRKDMIEEFIIYVNRNNVRLNSKIESSKYETNLMLKATYRIELIDYAAFFGSVQIFKYLYLNGAELKGSLWIYAIHGDNEEIIRILEDNQSKPENDNYLKCYQEAVMCYHNEIARYIETNYLSDEIMKRVNIKYFGYGCYNFDFLTIEFDDVTMYPLISLNYYELFELLLKEKKFNINKRLDISDNRCNFTGNHCYYTVYGSYTPLAAAIELNKIEFVKLLLSQPDIDINISLIEYFNNYDQYNRRLNYDFKREMSPLLFAYSMGRMKLVHMLMSNPKIDLNCKCIKKKITGTVVNGEINHDDPNNKIETVKDISLLSIAISKSDIEFTKLLLADPKINVNPNDFKLETQNCLFKFTPLILAIYKNNIELIRILLSKENIDVNCKFIKSFNEKVLTEKTALFMAVEKLNIEVVRLLLSNPKIEVNTIVTEKTKRRKITSKRTALYEAVRKNNNEIVKLLLSNPNIDVNIKTVNIENTRMLFSEKTALYAAVKNKNIEIVKLLLSNPGINVNIVSMKTINNDVFQSKKSALYLAVEMNNIEIIKLLLSNLSIDINFKSLRIYNYGENGTKRSEKTILYRAVEIENQNIIKILLSNQNIDVNEKSFKSLYLYVENDGEYIKCKTPLHAAVLTLNPQIVKILLDNEKIDINILDEAGRKPSELTDEEKIISLFKEH